MTQRTKMFFRVASLLLIAILLAGVRRIATAQAPASTPPAIPEPPGAVIKAESKLVIVDAVVTDKKGNYVHDLKQGDFKVYEDNKEQQVSTFSSGVDAAAQANTTIHRYMILFFDNSSMAMPDQIQARAAAAKFVDANAGPDRQMAVAEFGGALRGRVAGLDLVAHRLEGRHTGVVVFWAGPGGAGSRFFVGHAVTLARLTLEIPNHLLPVHQRQRHLHPDGDQRRPQPMSARGE